VGPEHGGRMSEFPATLCHIALVAASRSATPVQADQSDSRNGPTARP
jgi:hypothetical protein